MVKNQGSDASSLHLGRRLLHHQQPAVLLVGTKGVLAYINLENKPLEHSFVVTSDLK